MYLPYVLQGISERIGNREEKDRIYSQQKYYGDITSYYAKILDGFLLLPVNTFLVLAVNGGMKKSNNYGERPGMLDKKLIFFSAFFCLVGYDQLCSYQLFSKTYVVALV